MAARQIIPFLLLSAGPGPGKYLYSVRQRVIASILSFIAAMLSFGIGATSEHPLGKQPRQGYETFMFSERVTQGNEYTTNTSDDPSCPMTVITDSALIAVTSEVVSPCLSAANTKTLSTRVDDEGFYNSGAKAAKRLWMAKSKLN